MVIPSALAVVRLMTSSNFGWLLDRNVGRLRPAQNLVDQIGSASEQIREVWSVGHEPPGLDIIAYIENRRQPRSERKRDYTRAVGNNESSAHNEKCVRLGFERLEGGSDILRSADCEWRDLDAERTCRGLDFAHLQHGLGIAKINQDCQSAEMRDNLTQEFELLARNISRLERQSSDIAARFRQTCD